MRCCKKELGFFAPDTITETSPDSIAICSICNKKWGLFKEKDRIEVIDKNLNRIEDYQTVFRLFKEHQSETMCYGDGLWHFLEWCKEKIDSIKNTNI